MTILNINNNSTNENKAIIKIKIQFVVFFLYVAHVLVIFRWCACLFLFGWIFSLLNVEKDNCPYTTQASLLYSTFSTVLSRYGSLVFVFLHVDGGRAFSLLNHPRLNYNVVFIHQFSRLLLLFSFLPLRLPLISYFSFFCFLSFFWSFSLYLFFTLRFLSFLLSIYLCFLIFPQILLLSAFSSSSLNFFIFFYFYFYSKNLLVFFFAFHTKQDVLL